MICVSAGNTEFRDLLKILNREDLVEVRLDLNDFSDGELNEICASPAAVIAACRPGKFPEEERIRKLKLCADSGAFYIDFELESGEDAVKDMAAFVKPRGVKLILSHHNFDWTPAGSELEKIYTVCAELAADAVKIACMSVSAEDNARLLALYKLTAPRHMPPLIVVGMGKTGRITRAAAPFLGAPFIYAAAGEGKETAPGQLTKASLDKILQWIANG